MKNTNRIVKLAKSLLYQKLLLALIIIIAGMSLFVQGFFTPINFINIMIQVSTYGIIAFGMCFVIINGEIDLSVGSLMAFSGLFCAILINYVGIFFAIVLTLAMSFTVGVINGILVSKLKIDSFVVTLSGMVLFKGAALSISNGEPIYAGDSMFSAIANAKIASIPLLVFYFLIIFALVHFVLQKTTFGRNIYATGANEEVARTTGIKTGFYKASAFFICSTLAGLAGILLTAKLSTASPLMGDDAPLSVISGVVIGGVSLSGGKGNALNALLGIIFFGVLLNSLEVLRIYPYLQMAIKGGILIVVILADKLKKTRKKDKVYV